MSISGALSNALSGLSATARSAQIVSSNIANAITEGYGVREAVLSSRYAGDTGGVKFDGISRNVDEVLISDRRAADASFSSASQKNEALSRLDAAFGTVDDQGSLLSLVSNFQNSVLTATSNPHSDIALDSISIAAKSLVDKINQSSDAIQSERAIADREIATKVNNLNSDLQEVERLNTLIQKNSVLDHDTSALLDQRQILIDKINETVPVRILRGENGSVSLVSGGGEFLLDGSAKIIEFTASTGMTAYSSIDNGTLSGLSIDGRPLSASGENPRVGGGKLGSLFDLRDQSLPGYQAQLDALARELVERFDDPAIVGTATPADPGLFTDNGAVFDPLDEVGLSQRISLNVSADISAGGESWKIRDGLGTASPYDVGHGKYLESIAEKLSSFETPVSGEISPAPKDVFGTFSEVANGLRFDLSQSNQEVSYQISRLQALNELEAAQGVDSDHEMQKLLLIEQNYAANARVVQVIDEMLEWLMRI